MLFAIIGTSDRGNFVFDRWPRTKNFPKITHSISATQLIQKLTQQFYYFGIYRKNAVFRTIETQTQFSQSCFIEIFNANQKRLEVVLGIDDQCVMISRSVFIINNQRNFYPFNSALQGQGNGNQLLSMSAPINLHNTNNLVTNQNPITNMNLNISLNLTTQNSHTTNPPICQNSSSMLFTFDDLQQDRKDIVNSITLVWQASKFQQVQIFKDKLSFMIGVLRHREQAQDFLSKQIIKITQARKMFQKKLQERCLELNGGNIVSTPTPPATNPNPTQNQNINNQIYDEFKVKQIFQQFHDLADQYINDIQIFKQISKFYISCVSDSEYKVEMENSYWVSSVGHDYKVPQIRSCEGSGLNSVYGCGGGAGGGVGLGIGNKPVFGYKASMARREMEECYQQQQNEEFQQYQQQQLQYQQQQQQSQVQSQSEQESSQIPYTAQHSHKQSKQPHTPYKLHKIEQQIQQIVLKTTLATYKKIQLLPEVLQDQRIQRLYNKVLNVNNQSFQESVGGGTVGGGGNSGGGGNVCLNFSSSWNLGQGGGNIGSININSSNNIANNNVGNNNNTHNTNSTTNKQITINGALHTLRFLKQNNIAQSIYPFDEKKYYNLYSLKKMPTWPLIKKFNTKIFPKENILKQLHNFGKFKRIRNLDQKINYVILQDLIREVFVYVYFIQGFGEDCVGVDGDLGARRRENKGNLKKYYSIKMRERITQQQEYQQGQQQQQPYNSQQQKDPTANNNPTKIKPKIKFKKSKNIEPRHPKHPKNAQNAFNNKQPKTNNTQPQPNQNKYNKIQIKPTDIKQLLQQDSLQSSPKKAQQMQIQIQGQYIHAHTHTHGHKHSHKMHHQHAYQHRHPHLHTYRNPDNHYHHHHYAHTNIKRNQANFYSYKNIRNAYNQDQQILQHTQPQNNTPRPTHIDYKYQHGHSINPDYAKLYHKYPNNPTPPSPPPYTLTHPEHNNHSLVITHPLTYTYTDKQHKYNILKYYVNRPYNINQILYHEGEFEKISEIITLVIQMEKRKGQERQESREDKKQDRREDRRERNKDNNKIRIITQNRSLNLQQKSSQIQHNIDRDIKLEIVNNKKRHTDQQKYQQPQQQPQQQNQPQSQHRQQQHQNEHQQDKDPQHKLHQNPNPNLNPKQSQKLDKYYSMKLIKSILINSAELQKDNDKQRNIIKQATIRSENKQDQLRRQNKYRYVYNKNDNDDQNDNGNEDDEDKVKEEEEEQNLRKLEQRQRYISRPRWGFYYVEKCISNRN